MVQEALGCIQEREHRSVLAKKAIWGKLPPVEPPLLPEDLLRRMAAGGYCMVVSAYLNRPYVNISKEYCSMRLKEVHIFRDEGEKILVRIVREFEEMLGEDPVIQETEMVFSRAEITEVEVILLEEMEIPIDVRDLDSFIYF